MDSTPPALPAPGTSTPSSPPAASTGPLSTPQDLKDLGAGLKKGFLKAFNQGLTKLDQATAGTQARAKGEQILRAARRPGAWQDLFGAPGAATPLPIQEMRERVQAALADEQASSRLRTRIQAFVASKGANADAASSGVEMLHTALKEYVGRVPHLIELASTTAASRGQSAKFAPLLHMASRLFLAADDLIPESEGLYGMIDNAYLAVGVLDAASGEHAKRTGQPLFDVNLSGANSAVRELIGPEQAASLDAKIGEIKDHAVFKQAVKVALVAAGAAVATILVAGALGGVNNDAGRLIARQAARKLGGGTGAIADATGGPGSWGPSTEDEIARLCAQIGLST